MAFKVTEWLGKGLLNAFHRLIAWSGPDPYFYNPADFPWCARLEAATPAIQRELHALLARDHTIPNLQDVFQEQRILTQNSEWKSFFLYLYGYPIAANCAACPATAAALQQIPNMRTALFSILAPGKHIPEHVGPYKGVLRYHLGLIVPGDGSACRIRVGDETRQWKEGSSLVFDDTHPHEVWNNADTRRVVLFVDFDRPLPWYLRPVHRVLYALLRRTRFITDVVDTLDKHQKAK